MPAAAGCYDLDSGTLFEAGVWGVDAASASNDASLADVAARDDVPIDDVAREAALDPTVPAPRPIAPLTGARTTTTRPTLRWAAAEGQLSVIVELSRTRAFSVVEHHARADGSNWRSTVALSAGVWFWRLRGANGAREGSRSSAVWWFRVGQVDTAVDSSSGQELDVNGDGFGDVAIAGGGVVAVYQGGPTGLSSVPAIVLNGMVAGDDFGRSVASAGDVNGDGFSDLVVGAAPPVGRDDRGYARMFLGSASGLNAAAQATIEGVSATDSLGSSVAGVGDVDGDGFGDVAIGARGAAGTGAVQLHRGGPTGLASAPTVVWAGTGSFGSIVRSAGDVNGDGLADVIVGAQAANEASVYYGRALPLQASADIRLVAGSIAAQTRSYGESVAGVGDVNGDGFGDLAVGSGQVTVGAMVNAGVVRVFAGSRGGVQPVAIVEFSGVAANTRFGSAISGGDVNGDGLADIAIGAFEDDVARTDAGSVRLALGHRSAIATSGLLLVPGLTVNGAERFGTSVSLVADINSDSFADLVAGAPDAPTTRGPTHSGVARVWLGSSSVVAMTASAVFEPPAPCVGFARSVSN
jgi:hypothetical protein